MRPTTASRAVRALSIAAFLAVALVGCTRVSEPAPSLGSETAPVELTVSAATTLRKAFEQMAPGFEKASDAKLVFNFGASGVLQRQIEGGAAVDVFASASPAQVDALTTQGIISVEDTATFIGNQLVIVVPTGNPAGITGPEDLTKADRLTTGNPESAPTGTKAKEWLTNLGMWEGLSPRFIFGENAAQVTDYVARGEVDAAVMFASETAGRGDLVVVYRVPTGDIKPVAYVAAPLLDSTSAEIAREFVEYLLSPKGQQILADNGFAVYEPAK